MSSWRERSRGQGRGQAGATDRDSPGGHQGGRVVIPMLGTAAAGTRAHLPSRLDFLDFLFMWYRAGIAELPQL